MTNYKVGTPYYNTEASMSQTANSLDSVNMIHSTFNGKSDRIKNYSTYEWMDKDSDISRALDMIAEHCTQKNNDGDFFDFCWHTNSPVYEISNILKNNLTQWSKINRMHIHLYKAIRNMLKYGDWFMFRNPHTFELYDIHPRDVKGAVVDRQSLKIVGWIIDDFRWNVNDLEIDTTSNDYDVVKHNSYDIDTSRMVDSIHILHFSMSDGKVASSSSMNGGYDEQNPWPFGESWLTKAFKTFKQRELLEDAALIHRVQRAPSRNVWYIDTGKMRGDRVKYVVNNFKNELNQKRIPKMIGENSDGVDSTYDPISQLEDYYIPVSMDQRGSRVEQLEGTPWSDLPDLDHFSKKLSSALRVPYAWLQPVGEGGYIPTNGKIGQASQEEIEFSRFCSRVQTYVNDIWDHEFKMYCRYRDVLVNWSDFSINLTPPTDYQESKDRAVLLESVDAFKALLDVPFISKRMAFKKGLGWSDDLILENEKMVDEELNKNTVTNKEVISDDIPNIDSVNDEEDMEDTTEEGYRMLLSDISQTLNEDDRPTLPTRRNDKASFKLIQDDNSLKKENVKQTISLYNLRKLRLAHFEKRISYQKRLSTIGRIYGDSSESDSKW